MKALLDKVVSIDHSLEGEESIYPAFQHFVSTRLESLDNKSNIIKGIICVFDSKRMEKSKLDLTTTLLNHVHNRCVNELDQLQQKEHLINARDLASLDAENKLKFLADMSHEIRYVLSCI